MFKRINMGFNYIIAEEIIRMFNSDDVTEEIDQLVNLEVLNSDDLIKKIFEEVNDGVLKPSKYTLLHCFIGTFLFHFLNNERYYFFDTLCGDNEIELIQEFIIEKQKRLYEYGLDITDQIESIVNFDEPEDYDEALYDEFIEKSKNVYDDVLSNFGDVEDDIVDAVFYILFGNKGFLFDFNQYIAQYINTNYIDNTYFDEFSHIKRCSNIPMWLRRAVYYRDNGKCQHCGKDLSGYLSINADREVQLDHTIPLAAGGTNDPTNFQLLCSECNQEKGEDIVKPNYMYQMYWEKDVM